MAQGPSNSGVRIEYNHLGKLSGSVALHVIDKSAREIAFEVLRRAIIYLERQVYTRPNSQVSADEMSRVLEPTGALWNSGYVKSYTGELPAGCKSQQEAESSASSKNPAIMFGQAPPGPSRLGIAQVLFAVEYALFVEMGTVTGMIARPYLVPSVEEVRPLAIAFVKTRLLEAGFS